MTSAYLTVTATFLLVPAHVPVPPEVTPPIPAVRPFVSPDGRRVAYGARRAEPDGSTSYWLVISNLDGSDRCEARTAVQPFEEVLWQGNVTVLFTGAPVDNEYQALTARARPADPVRVPAGCEAIYKRLSPDGRALAFMGWVTAPGRDKRFGYFVVTLATGEVRQVLAESAKSAPAWSPDGRKLAVGLGDYVKDYRLAVVDVATGEVEFTGVNGVGAAWSPDGQFLAATTDAASGGSWFAGVPVTGRIGVWDLKNKALRHVSPPGRYTKDERTGRVETAGAIKPVWSPDGRWLAYQQCRWVPSGTPMEDVRETWVVRRDGTGARKVLDHAADIGWLPDGTSFFWTHDWTTGFVRVTPQPAPGR